MACGRTICFGTTIAAMFLVPFALDAAPAAGEAAAVALHAGNASNAVALATEALQDQGLSPRDRARVLVDRGMAHELLNERDGALVDFSNAINSRTLLPLEQARAFYDRGVTFDELGRADDAVDNYTAAVHIEPHFAAALNNRGNAYRRLGRMPEARADYQASIAAGNPNPEFPNYGLGQIAEASGQADAARAYYRAAIAANPQFTLASERLTLLGTTPSASEAPVVLRPPSQADIHLRPPGGSTQIHLRASGEGIVRLRRPEAAAPSPGQVAGLDLKPAFREGSGLAVGRTIQLGAWRSQGEAANAWSRIARVGGTLMAGLSPQVLPVDLPGKGRYYRLRASPADAGLCAALTTKGVACIVVRD